MDNITLGIVIPVFGSTRSVAELVHQIHTVFTPVCTYHIYLVDDGNPENVSSWLRKNCRLPHVTLIRLKHNYGQQNAVLCGLCHAGSCRYIATMDDDLQHSPATLLRLYQTILKGFDIVYAVPGTDSRRQPSLTGGSPVRILGSRMRDLLFRVLLKLPSHIKVSSFRIMTGELAAEISGQAAGFLPVRSRVLPPQKGCDSFLSCPAQALRPQRLHTEKAFGLILEHYPVLRPICICISITKKEGFCLVRGIIHHDIRRLQLPASRCKTGQGQRLQSHPGGLYGPSSRRAVCPCPLPDQHL